MLTTNSNFDAKHDLDYKSPMYVIHFDGEAVDYCNQIPVLGALEALDCDDGTEVDTASRLTVSAAAVGVQDLDDDEEAYNYHDFGAGYFSGNFKMRRVLWATSTGLYDGDELCGVWCMANTLNAYGQMDASDEDNLTVYLTGVDVDSFTLTLREGNGSSNTEVTSIELDWSSFYYLEIERNEDISANGVLYCKIYSDSSYSTLVDVLAIELTEKQDFQYLYDVTSYGTGAGGQAVSIIVYKTYIERQCKKYLAGISGSSQSITPEEGTASIGGVSFNLTDYNDEITALLATDTYNFHRKKTTIKAGYKGMNETDMLTVCTGWVTGLSLTSDGLAYKFQVTDPQKWLQRKIFRGAETTPVNLQGNPINILLAVLQSTGLGTNGTHDYLDAENGLGLSSDYINVTDIESVRNKWFPTNSHYMKFTITERQTAKEFIEKEILKVLNCYPVIDGSGKYSIRPYKPPLAGYEKVQTFNDDVFTKLPSWDANLSALVNEVEFFYDHDGDDFQTQEFYADTTSINNRGPGNKPISIKSMGLHTSVAGASISMNTSDVITRRKNSIFNRFAAPPLRVSVTTFFNRWLTEVGDILPVTSAYLPDIEAGTRGLDARRMEAQNITPNWDKGSVTATLLDTGYAKNKYAAISPCMTVTAGSSGTSFTVSAADAAKYANFTDPEVQMYDSHGRAQGSHVTITDVNTTTGVITCDDIGSTPSAGWTVRFCDYDDATSEQQDYGYLSDGSGYLGTANDAEHYII